MLTLKECRKLIDPKGENYSDEELLKMEAFLSELAVSISENLKPDHEKESRIDVKSIQ